MSLEENEDFHISSANEDFHVTSAGTEHESIKQPKIKYSRAFLLSFRELDICKELPAGFDQSILGEFEDVFVSESQRVPGGLSSLSSKRSGYGTSPPNNYSRGSHGRWETRSSGSNDKDGELQSDRELESGRRYGNQSRRPWQNPEHDGLLGSGAFARPSGYNAGGSAAPKVRGTGHNQLGKSFEPYQPPRPNKGLFMALTQSRRDGTDSFNDETFGSSECSNEDRAEEERKRRASFELMRKEQHKALQEKLQEKQKHGPEKHKEQTGTDIAILLEKSEDERSPCSRNTNTSDDFHVEHVCMDNSVKCSLPKQAPTAARPLVPPGFASTVMEKNLGVKSFVHFSTSEVGQAAIGDNVTEIKSDVVANGSFNDQDIETKSAAAENISENTVPASGVEITGFPFALERHPPQEISDQSEGISAWPDDAVADFEGDKLTRYRTGDTVSQGKSILQKLFGSASSINGVDSPKFVELQHQAGKIDEDPLNSISSTSSKFAHWFLDEEKRTVDDRSSSKARDLFSLIHDKGEPQVSAVLEERTIEHLPIVNSFENDQVTQKLTIPTSSSATPDASLPVLTCEELEQFILADANDSSPNLQNTILDEPWGVLNAKVDPPKTDVDDHASQHLLSLLQKGTSLKEPTSPEVDVKYADKTGVNLGKSEEVYTMEKSLTLETLFGSAFMKELHSVGAPLSVQAGSIGGVTRNDVSDVHGLPFPLATHTNTEYEPNKTSLGNKFGALGTASEANMIKGHWLGFDNPQTKVDGTVELQLPEEENLISMGRVHVDRETSKVEECLSSNPPVEIVDKLAALNAILKGERSIVPGLETNPHNFLVPREPELPYQHLRFRNSPPQFPQHMNHHHTRPFFQHAMDPNAHRSPQMQFVSTENIHHRDPHGPLPPNAFHSHHHSFHGPGGVGFDTPLPPLHQMPPTRESILPPHLLQGLPRGVPLSHLTNHVGSYVPPELGLMQGFPLNNRQSDFSGTGVMIPGSGNHQEALERLEMELRANEKQRMLQIAAGQGPGMYGPPQLDMGFRYR